MNDLIQRVTNAIIRQEGMPADFKDPGNLRAAPWRQRAVIVHGFWCPASRAEGVAGAAHEVALRIAEGQTLFQLIRAWAPPSENNTSAYVQNVAEWAAIPDINVALWDYLGA